MNNKKRSLRNIYIILTGMCIASVIFITSTAVNLKNTREESRSQLPAATETMPESGYLIKEYKGSVAIFTDDNKIYDILELNINLLSEEDKKSIQNGLYLENKKELNTFIEDFTS